MRHRGAWRRASGSWSFRPQGMRNREIAERLGVTEGTVKAYLHAIFESSASAAGPSWPSGRRIPR